MSSNVTGAPSLWLVRHAQPLIAPDVCYGALDVAADPLSTQATARALAQTLPTKLLVVSSVLQRCELLAQSLKGLRPDLIDKTDDRLSEINFGCWEGQRWDAIPKEAYDSWTTDFWQHPFGGVESLAGFMQRVAAAWDEAAGSGQDQVWITHAGVIRAVSLLSQGLRQVTDATQWPAAAPAFGQWLVLPLTRV